MVLAWTALGRVKPSRAPSGDGYDPSLCRLEQGKAIDMFVDLAEKFESRGAPRWAPHTQHTLGISHVVLASVPPHDFHVSYHIVGHGATSRELPLSMFCTVRFVVQT